MNKTLTTTAIKYGLIIGVAAVVFGSLATGSRENLTEGTAPLAIAGVVLMWLLKIALLGRAHYEYNQKNNGYISFKDAIIIGLIVIGVSQVLSIAFSIINYQFIMKEEMDKLYEGLGYSISPVSMLLTSAFSGIVLDIVVLFLVITMEAQWKIFKKAGHEGWAAFVPVYNTIVMLDIVGKPVVWFFLLCIPFVNIIFAIWIVNLLAKRFGKDEGYTVGLLVLPFIFYPLLGLSEEKIISEEAV